MPLEKDEVAPKAKALSTFNMTEILGQFIRYMHLYLMCSLQEEGKKANLYPTNP